MRKHPRGYALLIVLLVLSLSAIGLSTLGYGIRASMLETRAAMRGVKCRTALVGALRIATETSNTAVDALVTTDPEATIDERRVAALDAVCALGGCSTDPLGLPQKLLTPGVAMKQFTIKVPVLRVRDASGESLVTRIAILIEGHDTGSDETCAVSSESTSEVQTAGTNADTDDIIAERNDWGSPIPACALDNTCGACVPSETVTCGDGTVGMPYSVAGAAQLEAIGTDAASLSQNYELVADVDLAGVTFTPIGSAATPFTGTIDGNGFAIQNLTMNAATGVAPSTDRCGFIDTLSGTLTNLTFETPTVNCDQYVAIVAVATTPNSGALIQNVVVNNATMEGQAMVGPIVVQLAKGTTLDDADVVNLDLTMTNPTSSPSICFSSPGCIGGAVTESKGTMTKIRVSGTMNLTGSLTVVGGVAGAVYGLLSSCESHVAINGSASVSRIGGVVGGLFSQSNSYDGNGQLVGIMEDCYADGLVQGGDQLGGLAGGAMGLPFPPGGTGGGAPIMRRNYAAGAVKTLKTSWSRLMPNDATYPVAIINADYLDKPLALATAGNRLGVNVTSTYWDGDVIRPWLPSASTSGSTSGTAAANTEKTTAELMTPATFTGWSSLVWVIGTSDRPRHVPWW